MVEMNSFDGDLRRGRQEFMATDDGHATSQDYQQPQNDEGPMRRPTSHQSAPNRPPGGTGHPDLIDSIWASVNQDLLVAKTFYFFFFSAFGSLFPLMGIFFKNLGMNPVQCGVLVGFRPFVEFVSSPLWGTVADRYRKGRLILLFSLASWIIFTLTLCFVQPPVASCIYHNKTHYMLTEPGFNTDELDFPVAVGDEQTLVKRSALSYDSWQPSSSLSRVDRAVNENHDHHKNPVAGHNTPVVRHKIRDAPPDHVIGTSPGDVSFASNYDPRKHESFMKPAFSTIVYRKADITHVFFTVMLLVVVGEFFSAPAITLADSVTLTYLGDKANNYGRQRMFGSLGWGLAMFFVGIALDHATIFPNHPCGPHDRERNYTICFAVFSVLMGCAFITATQFRFDYEAAEATAMAAMTIQTEPDDGSIAMKTVVDKKEPYATDAPAPPSPKASLHLDGLTQADGSSEDDREPQKSTVFASHTRRVPELLRVLKTFTTIRYGAFLFVAWFMGLGVGLVFTFLFWHLQELEGTPTLFGVASVINHISEIFAYFFSFRLIKQIGHVKVLCLGLAGNVARFLYLSWLYSPWWALPFEFIQGITHAAVWAACCSYITQSTPENLRSSAQGVLQGLHHGLGRGCGAVLGGLIATYYGTAVTFRVYGFLCLIVLGVFIFINFYRKDRGFSSADAEEPHHVLEENSYLAPHGVPSSPMPRALSSARFEDLDLDSGTGNPFGRYGTGEKQNGPFLDIPKHGGGGGGWGPTESETGDQHHQLDSAFQSKRSLTHSPEVMIDFDYIRENFKAYREALRVADSRTPDEDYGNLRLLKAPLPITVLHTPQRPANNESYDW